MPHLPSLPANARLNDVFKRFPKGLAPLLAYHDALLREESPLTVAERELIAAHVSAVNGCRFCAGAHALMAQAFGVPEAALTALQDHPETAPVPDKMKALLAYVRKLTETPSRMTARDAAAVLDAGWSEEALYDAVAICGLYNLMNRIVDAMGIEPGPELLSPSEKDIAERQGRTYTEWAESKGLLP